MTEPLLTRRATVTHYNSITGMAYAVYDEGGSVAFSTLTFYPGRPARHPRKGDRVDVRSREEGGACVPVLARLVKDE